MKMNAEVEKMAARDEAELRRIVAFASVPEPPSGAQERLMARIATIAIEAPPADNVVLFRPRASAPSSWFRYAAALPLAASLALGIYLGAAGSLDFALPALVTGDVATNLEADEDLNGVSEAEQYAEENLS
jgi:hypothetical protein